jgi:hypothetical protein
MEMPSRQPNKLRPRVDYRPEDFRKLLFTRGMDLTWEQGQLCPCRRQALDYVGTRMGQADSLGVKGESSEPRPDCDLCEGSGYFWHSAQTVKALVTRAASTPEAYAAWGERARAMVFLTLLPEHVPTFLDRFTMKDSVITFRESRLRTSSAVEALRYPIVTRSLDLAAGQTDVSVLHLQAANSSGVASASLTKAVGTDFAVTDGKIDWTLGVAAGTAPAEGDRYSVSYYASPRYVVTDHPHAYRDTFNQVKSTSPSFTALPVQCSAVLDFLGDL